MDHLDRGLSQADGSSTNFYCTIDQCRAEAAECRRRAMVCCDLKKRARYLSLAKLWDHTAAELEIRAA